MGGGGWSCWRTATTPNPSLPRRGITFITGIDPKNRALFAQNDSVRGASSSLSGSTMTIPVTTTLNIDGYRIREYKGVVRGIIVRAPTIAQGILGGLKSIIGGRIGAYTEMCEQARQQAYDLMIEHAQEVGANAVVGLHYDASEVVGRESATEVLCYGTAVVIEPLPRS